MLSSNRSLKCGVSANVVRITHSEWYLLRNSSVTVLSCGTEVSGTIIDADAVEYSDETDDADAVDLRRSHIAAFEGAMLSLSVLLLGWNTTPECGVDVGGVMLIFFSGYSGVDLDIFGCELEGRPRKTGSGPGSS